MARKRKEDVGSGIVMRGIYRLHIVNPDGSVASDTGWHKNIVTDQGFQQFLLRALTSSANCGSITHAALGSGTAPQSNSTNLSNELTQTDLRRTVSFASTGSKSVAICATWASGWVTTSQSSYQLNNVGLFNTSTQGAATMLCGNTFTQQTCSTNQAVNLTYNLIFATA